MALSADDLTAYGTLALAVVTLVTLGATAHYSRRSEAQLRRERQEDADRDHEALAAAVQVTGVQTVAVINHGAYAITRVQARLRLSDGTFLEYGPPERLLRHDEAVGQLAADVGSERTYQKDIVTPWDIGLRFRLDPGHGADPTGAYPVVRWTDHWNTAWQYQRGQTTRTAPEAPWPAS